MSEYSKFQGLPHTPYMDALGQAPQMNVKNNIIAGPNAGQYWNHSPGLERPTIREEGPFPVQGNIGNLMVQESNNYSSCGGGPPVAGSPNCTSLGTFRPDMYTSRDSCGDNCVLSYPESFGGKSFGLKEGNKVTNSHALHAYKNERASMEGSGPSQDYGCYEWTPRLTKTQGNSCTLDQYPAYQTVGAWNQLSQNASVVDYSFKP